MEIKKKIKLWIPVLVWCGLIYFISSLSINNSDKFSWMDFTLKKAAHMVEYAVLYWLIWRAWSNNGKSENNLIFTGVFLVSLIYALSDEWHQTLVPGRGGTLRDVGFDSIGMFLSLIQIKKRL